ncbi:alpha/beta hydrolase [Cupriavidus sp. 2SB]|uniref:alpha/beta fold hydrolase n=1 Tax=Cupriavidus sp. 2SB TaxID=2502199 RepID=UPI0010F97CFB|nr:alpha/beta hydrolase [Cupriavidus sp. 2SB]
MSRFVALWRALSMVLLAAFASLAGAQQQPAKTVVLVHGAFADGSSWQKVIPELQKAGLRVVAVQNPLDSLENDVAVTRRAIREADGPVVLVGHSWGGVVITEAGNDPKVRSLVYVAAFAPDTGQSAHDIAGKYPQPPGQQTFVKDADGFLKVSDEGVRKYFAADLTPTEQDVIAAVQGRFHVRTLTAPISQAAWRTRPSFMVVSINDTIISPQLQRDQVQRAKATAIEVPSSHVAMLSHPKAVADLIVKAAK